MGKKREGKSTRTGNGSKGIDVAFDMPAQPKEVVRAYKQIVERQKRAAGGGMMVDAKKAFEVIGSEMSNAVQLVAEKLCNDLRGVAAGRPKGSNNISAELFAALEDERLNNWQKGAILEARKASEIMFHSRRGVEPYGEFGILIYNNNPYAKGPEFREQQTRELRAWLNANRFEEMAYAEYPGESKGYSFAMIVKARVVDHVVDIASDLLEVAGAYREIVRQTFFNISA